MRDVSVQADEVLLKFGWYAAQSAGQEHEVVHNMADEIVRLREALAAACVQGTPMGEAHTTRVRVLDEWRVTDKDGMLIATFRTEHDANAFRVGLDDDDEAWPMYAPHRVVRVALVDASAAAGREVTREGTVARFLRGIRDREAQGLTYWVVDDADTLRIDLHELASAVARTVNNDPQTPEGSEPVSNAYQLSTAERAVIEAAKAYEKWMGNWHDYTVRSGDKPAKQQRALIDAVRALARAGGAKR
jgi:hypothetical protein